MSELLPCPFCGGKPISYEYMGGHIIICRSCGINLTCSRGENFVKKWNRRHYPPEVEKVVERMKPKKVIRKRIGNNPVHVCPGCGYSWDSFLVHEMRVKPENCPRCGQRLDWSE